MSDEEEGEAAGDVEVPKPETGRRTSSRASRKSSSSTTGSQQAFEPRNQQLFLVEFLIDTVNLDSSGFCEELMEGQTCVTLKFLNFPPMNICERDFDPNKDPGYDKIRFNSGKSLMFAFAEKQCVDPPPMMAELIVSKKCPEGSPSEKVDLGVIKICMVQLFQQVYEVAKFTPDKLPASKSIKDCFMLIGRGRRTTGEVGVYIRLTCLGQNVVTEFQCGPDLKQDPFLFKNREGKKVYQFMGADRNEEECEDDVRGYREGCGCLGPPPPSKCAGGQGDAGRKAPPRPGRTTSVGGAFAKGNRVVLDLPDKANRCQGGHNVDRYKVTNKNADVQVTQDSLLDKQRNKDGYTVDQMNTNPDQNCFVLKVGDKGQIPDRGKMILEFRTPKQKILPKILPPYHEEIAVQTDSPKKAKGKKKGKGKK